MRYKTQKTPRLARLIKNLAPYLRRYGRLSELARFSDCYVQAAQKWYLRGIGRPPAPQALRALRWKEEISRKPTLRFIPEWEDLRRWAGSLVASEGAIQELAEVAKTDLKTVEKHLLSEKPGATRPDGEFGLAVLDWYCWSRTSYQIHGHARDMVRAVMQEEEIRLSERTDSLNRPHRLIMITRDLPE